MFTSSGGIDPSILVVQTAENRLRNDPSSLGYCFDLVDELAKGPCVPIPHQDKVFFE